jgi:hypothetical protein
VGIFFVAFMGLLALRQDSNASRLTARQAEAAALAAPQLRSPLAGGFTRVRTMPLDARTVRVSFFDGPRAVAEAGVGPDGRIQAVIRHGGRARLGSDVGQRPAVLIGLVALFLLATLRLPLLRQGNLDALAFAAVALPIVLLNERYLEWSALAGGLLLAYLTWRCLRVALCRADRDEPAGGWLMDALPRRVTVLVAAATGAGLVLLSIPGGLVSDVGFASLAGATEILDGRAPYGNLAFDGLVHGDTYPLLAYLAYVPAALLEPVRDGFADLDGALFVATAFALAGALALGRAGGRRLAIAFLAFPPVMVACSSGSSDAVAAALVAGALALAVRAGTSAALMTAAGWVKLGPLALIPLWVARRRGRSVTRAVAGAAAVTAAVATALVALGGPDTLADMADALSFQSQRGSPMSLWALLELPVAQVAFQAALLTGLALGVGALWRDPALAADPTRIAALAAAVLFGVQLAANHWAATYLVWAFPLAALALLGRPKPSRPPARAS